MEKCQEVEKCALEKLGNIIVAATIDAEGAKYIENFSKGLVKSQVSADNAMREGERSCQGEGKAAHNRSLRAWREPQVLESGRIAAADAERRGYQKWEPMQFPRNAKRRMGAPEIRRQGEFLNARSAPEIGRQGEFLNARSAPEIRRRGEFLNARSAPEIGRQGELGNRNLGVRV